ncbi:MAG: hypothetical protein HY897_15125 [Deltaproteobacteria bacterium]|nr:hypothetical protein [Deltaproteobacteria bacterium]
MAEKTRETEAEQAARRAEAASRAAADVLRKHHEVSLCESVVKHGWRPSLAGMASAVVVLATVAGGLVYVLKPPVAEPIPGSWMSPDRSFALLPPDNWIAAGPASLDKVTGDAGLKASEWVRRLVGHDRTVAAFLKLVGERDSFPALVVGSRPGKALPDASFRAAAPIDLSSGLAGLFDSVVVDSVRDAVVDGLPAVIVSAVGQKRTLVAPAETVYREVEGGYEVDGRTEEQWAVRKVRFVQHVIAGPDSVFDLTLAADDAEIHRVDIPMQRVVASFRSLKRPPLLPDEMRQLVIGAAAVVIAGLVSYLALAVRALVKSGR